MKTWKLALNTGMAALLIGRVATAAIKGGGVIGSAAFNKFKIDPQNCSLSAGPDDNVYITLYGKGKEKQLAITPYTSNEKEFVVSAYQFEPLEQSFRFKSGSEKSGAAYGGQFVWDTKITSEMISSKTGILQKRETDKEPKMYFSEELSLRQIAPDRLQYTFTRGKKTTTCQFIAQPANATRYTTKTTLKNVSLRSLEAKAVTFGGDLDQMNLEIGKAKYTKAGSLTNAEIREMLNLHILPHANTVVLEPVTTKAAFQKSLGRSLDKLMEFANDPELSMEDKSEYAPLQQIYSDLSMMSEAQGLRVIFVDWGNGGDSMGHGLLFIDENAKHSFYIGNGDYI